MGTLTEAELEALYQDAVETAIFDTMNEYFERTGKAVDLFKDKIISLNQSTIVITDIDVTDWTLPPPEVAGSRSIKRASKNLPKTSKT